MGVSNEHAWSAPDIDGVRECRNEGCTVRTRRELMVWQRKKGAHWREVASLYGVPEPIPPCAGVIR